MSTKNKADILTDPRRIFSLDEFSFFLHPKPGKILAKRGNEQVYQARLKNECDRVAVLCVGNAYGDVPPPMIVFNYQQIPNQVQQNVPCNVAVGLSKLGWMTAETFYDYIRNHFVAWINEKEILLPVVLFVDGHSSHLSMNLSCFCHERGIVLIALHPNEMHSLHPIDVGMFDPLKEKWQENRDAWTAEHGDMPFTRAEFPQLLWKTIEFVTDNTCVLWNAFQACGI